ncbi:MAG: sulfatase-like hydrolase/transferase, partial [Phycisphaerales bacterium JB038]
GLSRVGMIFNEAHKTHGLRAEETTVASCLKQVGYRTALIGKWHLGHGAVEHYPTRHGFDEFYGALGGCIDYFDHAYAFVPDWYRGEQPLVEEGYSTTLLTREAVDFLERQSAARPFFLCLTYFAPHYGKSLAAEAAVHDHTLSTAKAGGERTNPRTGEACQPINSLQAPLEDLRQVRHIEDPKRRYYTAMVRALDDGVGEVLAALQAADLDENTIVLFLADNGPDMTVSNAGDHGPLRGAKHSLWEGGIRVPAALQWPARLKAGQVLDVPVSALDLLPTFCALSAAPLPAGPIDGLDVTGALFAGQPLQRTLYWRQGRQEAVRRGDWKLIYDDLYNVAADPGEQRDLAAQKPDLVAELVELREMMRRSLTLERTD